MWQEKKCGLQLLKNPRHTGLNLCSSKCKMKTCLVCRQILTLGLTICFVEDTNKLTEEIVLELLSSQTLNSHAEGRTSFIFYNEMPFLYPFSFFCIITYNCSLLALQSPVNSVITLLVSIKISDVCQKALQFEAGHAEVKHRGTCQL